MLFLFTSYHLNSGSSPVEVVCFQQWILVSDFPPHAPSESSSFVEDCPLFRGLGLALWESLPKPYLGPPL